MSAGKHLPCRFPGCSTIGYSGGLCKRHIKADAQVGGRLKKAVSLGLIPTDSWTEADYDEALSLIDLTPSTPPPAHEQIQSKLQSVEIPKHLDVDDIKAESEWQLARQRFESAQKSAVSTEITKLELDSKKFEAEIQRGLYVRKDEAVMLLRAAWTGLWELLDVLPPLIAHQPQDTIRELLRTELAKHGRSLAERLEAMDD